MDKIKKCVTCGKLFEKKINCSKKEWALSKYCSRSCINKGRISRFRGLRPMSDERKKHLSDVLLGRTCNTGRTHIKKGQCLYPSTQFKKGNIPWSKGKKLLYNAGEKNNKWKGGVTPEHSKIRHSPEMKELRKTVFKRDNYSCISCGRKRKPGDRVILELHHLKPFSSHPELRLDEKNVITLCRECHQKTDSWGKNL